MDNSNRADYENKINDYIENNKIPDYFESLTQQLIINQPDDPYKFLMEYLEQRKRQRIILIHGIIPEQRNEIVQELGSLINYCVKSVKSNKKDSKLESDESMNQQVDEFVNKLESHFTGLLVSGYPNTYQQALHSQKNKKIPERIFIIRHSDQALNEHYQKIYGDDKNQIAAAKQRDLLDEKEMIKQYNDYVDIFQIDNYSEQKKTVVQNMQHILQLKDSKVAPLRSPRVIITAPPHIRKRLLEVAKVVSKEYGLYLIDLQSVIDDHINRKTEVGKYLFRNQKMRKDIPLDILTALAKTQMLKPVAKHKGFVLIGYPTNMDQLNAVISLKINPNLILTLQENETILKNQYNKILYDTVFGTRYEADLEVDETTKNRLKLDEFSEEEQDQKIAEYTKLLQHINGNFGKFVVKANMSTEDNELVMRNVNAHLNNPSVYGGH